MSLSDAITDLSGELARGVPPEQALAEIGQDYRLRPDVLKHHFVRARGPLETFAERERQRLANVGAGDQVASAEREREEAQKREERLAKDRARKTRNASNARRLRAMDRGPRTSLRHDHDRPTPEELTRFAHKVQSRIGEIWDVDVPGEAKRTELMSRDEIKKFKKQAQDNGESVAVEAFFQVMRAMGIERRYENLCRRAFQQAHGSSIERLGRDMGVDMAGDSLHDAGYR